MLSAAEKAGVTLSTIEDLGLLTKAEDLGLISAAVDRETPGLLNAVALALFAAGPAAVYFLPEDTPTLVAVQAVVALVCVLGGSAAFGAATLLSKLRPGPTECRRGHRPNHHPQEPFFSRLAPRAETRGESEEPRPLFVFSCNSTNNKFFSTYFVLSTAPGRRSPCRRPLPPLTLFPSLSKNLPPFTICGTPLTTLVTASTRLRYSMASSFPSEDRICGTRL